VAHLHKFSDLGADIVCISGGKAIQAPNNTFIMLGKGKGTRIIASVRNHSFPHPGWGRGHKISKEQIVGLVAALEIFIQEGDGLYEKQMRTARYFTDALDGISGLKVSVVPNDETYHEHPVMPHVPRVLMEWDARQMGLTAEDLDRAMAQEDPPVFLRNAHYFNYYTNSQWRMIDTFFLREGEPEIIARRLKRVFTGS